MFTDALEYSSPKEPLLVTGSGLFKQTSRSAPRRNQPVAVDDADRLSR